MTPPYRLVVACSCAALSFGILLVRIFSIRLSYHYAALIISLSMAGLVIGGCFVFCKQQSARPLNYIASRLLQYVAGVLAISCPAVFILLAVIPLDHVRMLWDNVQISYLVLFVLLCTVPFFFYGVLISWVLSLWPEKSNRIYAGDLLGGAAGLLATAMLMNTFKVEYVVVIVALGTGSIIISALDRTAAKIILGSFLFAVCIPVAAGKFPLDISPYKGLMQALKDDNARHIKTLHSSHSRLDLFENPRMKVAPGLSLTFQDRVPDGTGMALDGEIVGAIMDWNRLETFDFLLHMPAAFPYLLVQPKNVIIIGAKNSIDLMLPHYFGALQIYAAEHDASVLKSLDLQRKDYGLHASMTIFSGSGRSLLKNLPGSHGLVFLSRTGFFPSGNFGIQEDYDLTVESIAAYMRSLSKNGALFIQMYLLPPPRLELRLAVNIIAALNKLGIQEPRNHLLIYRSWDTINFFIKRNGFSEADFQSIRQFLTSRQFDLLYPEITGHETFIKGLDYRGLFSQILHQPSSVDFVSSYTFDIRETSDDRPFFHYFLKIRKIAEIYELSGKKWIYFLQEGMFLPFILVLLILLAMIIFIIVFLFSRFRINGRNAQRPKFKILSLSYFILIGFAFMFVEVFFIHRLILPFGSPVTAYCITLTAILLSAGMGSFISGWAGGRKMVWIMGCTPFLIIVCRLLFDQTSEIRASAFFIAPIGVVLGFFFPTGLRYLVNTEWGGAPLAYTANGAASIIAPSLASLVAVIYGCNILLVLAAILYAAATAIILPAVYRVSNAAKHS